MAKDWSQEEVEATVADYFDMLTKELQGTGYNKTEHRRRLSKFLNSRSDGSIERKHQNISAILIKLGFPYIFGYKPLGNYQQLLFHVVSSRLESSEYLTSIVKTQIYQPADLPDVSDILASLVDPPSPVLQARNNEMVRETSSTRYHVDYLAQESRNRSLGTAGEEFVVRFEQARLIYKGREDLASKVENIAVTQGDGAGFDILSFEETGEERFIEVKTTAYGPFTPFYVTRNELDVSYKSGMKYHLYRTFDFRRRPRVFTKQGALDRSFQLNPTQYLARLS